MKMKKTLLAFAAIAALLVFGTACSSGGDGGEVYVYSYGDYYDQEVISEFEAETGIKVIQDTYDTAEEMYPVIEKNSTNYDVICTSDYMIEKMIENNLLAELDKDNIPNLENLDPVYMEKSESFDPGNKYSVPHTAGVAGIIYNKTMVGDEKIDSWADLWNPAFKGQVVMPDSVRDDFMIALRQLGYDQNTTNEAEIKAAADLLKEQKPLVYKYANDSARDLLADGSAALGVVWNGEYMYTKDLNDDVEFVVPKEGTEFFIDSWAVPATAENKTNAEIFIDYMCKKEVAAKNFDYLYYTMPNKAAYDEIDADLMKNEAIFPSNETLARCSSLKNLPAETQDLYAKYWKEVKAD